MFSCLWCSRQLHTNAKSCAQLCRLLCGSIACAAQQTLCGLLKVTRKEVTRKDVTKVTNVGSRAVHARNNVRTMVVVVPAAIHACILCSSRAQQRATQCMLISGHTDLLEAAILSLKFSTACCMCLPLDNAAPLAAYNQLYYAQDAAALCAGLHSISQRLQQSTQHCS